MKYGKKIIEYKKSIQKNKYMNNKDLRFNNYSLIQYKILKQHIKKICIDNDNKIYLYDECCICMEELGINYVTLQCNHSYHTQCAINLFKYSNKCSLCRKNIGDTFPMSKFIYILKINIDSIENFHNIMRNIINNKKIKSNCLWIRWNSDIMIMERLLKQFDIINSIGVRKILKKFTKKSKYNTDHILNYCKDLNFYNCI